MQVYSLELILLVVGFYVLLRYAWFAGRSGSEIHLLCVAIPLGIGFILTGIEHLVFASRYVELMAPRLPAKLTLIYVSAVLRIFSGAAILIPGTRVVAAIAVIVLMVIVIPVNVRTAITGQSVYGWCRLILHASWIGWAVWCWRLASFK